LTAGITACAEREKTFLDIALWIARNLVSIRDRELALKIGVWGINRLCELPIFELGDADVLELVLSEPLDAFLDDVLVREIKSNPHLAPQATLPEPWTQVRTGGLPPGHWGTAVAYPRPPPID
jgi:hypothetical protein